MLYKCYIVCLLPIKIRNIALFLLNVFNYTNQELDSAINLVIFPCI